MEQAIKKQQQLSSIRHGVTDRPRSLLLPPSSLASIESLSMPPVYKVVVSADLGCSECQKRVSNVLSRLQGIESMVVDVLEKKVTLTCASVMNGSSRSQVAAISKKKNSESLKISGKNLLILLLPSCT